MNGDVVNVAGYVEAVGKDVQRLRPGAEIFGGCKGSRAEYVSARESELALQPAVVTTA